MRLKDTLASALRALWTTPMRSGLTMLGIIVGVAAVVLIAGLGNGLRTGFDQAYLQSSTRISLSKSGANQPGNQTEPLTERDFAAVERADPESIVRVTPSRTGSAVMRTEGNTFRALITASAPEAQQANGLTVATGRFFTDADDAVRARVVVIGTEAVKYLFADDARGAIGQTVSVGRLRLTVIGTTASTGRADNTIFLPLSTGRLLVGGSDNLNGIIAQARSADAVPAAVESLYRAMDESHRIRDPATRDYRVFTATGQLESVYEFVKFIAFFIVGVAALALFVGAIGVANIMLVAVTERTREIGLLKALGARSAAVLRQFLTEAALITGLGGVLGAGLGIVLTVVGAGLLPRYVPQAGPLTVQPVAVVAAVGVSVLIGLVAGSYPAYRAARLRPIEALRA